MMTRKAKSQDIAASEAETPEAVQDDKALDIAASEAETPEAVQDDKALDIAAHVFFQFLHQYDQCFGTDYDAAYDDMKIVHHMAEGVRRMGASVTPNILETHLKLDGFLASRTFQHVDWLAYQLFILTLQRLDVLREMALSQQVRDADRPVAGIALEDSNLEPVEGFFDKN